MAQDMMRLRTGTAAAVIMTGTGANDANEMTVLQMPTNTEPTEPTSPAPAAAPGNPIEGFLEEVNRRKNKGETVPYNVETALPVFNKMILMIQEHMCDPCHCPDEATHLKNLASDMQNYLKPDLLRPGCLWIIGA